MNTYTPTQLKDALRILKALRDSQEYSKAVRQALAIAIYIIEETRQKGSE